MTPRPLDGITVISLEQAVAAPFATRQLADLGARVIKVERPGEGDFARRYDTSVEGQSSYFVWLNRSKESLTLDVKDPAGAEVLHALLATADVFVHNLVPGAIERLGFGRDVLAARNPRLIDCTISGFGATGSLAHRKAYDLLIQSEVGLLSITGTPADIARAGISVADIAAGMYAYSGLLTALLQRALTGVVSPVDVSLFDALAEWMGAPLYYAHYGGTPPPRVGASHATIAPYGAFATADGTILLAIQNEREWAELCRAVLGDGALATDVRFATNSLRVDNRSMLDGVVGACLATLTTAAAAELLDRAGVANARVNGVEDLTKHPAVVDRGRWVDVATPAGQIGALLPPAILGGVAPMMGAVPAVGEHTAEILLGLGYDAAAIERLRQAHVV